VRGQRRRGIRLSFEGLLSRDGRASEPLVEILLQKKFWRRSLSRESESSRIAQPRFFLREEGQILRLLSGSPGSTRLMKHGVQCSRGSRDDRSERAPGPIPPPEVSRKRGIQGRIRGALTSPLGNSRSRQRQRLRAFTGARQRSRSWQGEGGIPRS